jgi:hypothetical protein
MIVLEPWSGRPCSVRASARMEVRPLGVDTGQVGVEEAGAAERGLEKLRIDQLRACDVGMAQVCAARVGNAKISAFEGARLGRVLTCAGRGVKGAGVGGGKRDR